METLAQFCVETVTAAGGSMPYRDLYNAVPAEQRPRLRDALKVAKAEGNLKQEVAWADGVLSHTVSTVGSA